MIDMDNEDIIKKEFRKILLNLEKENLSQLHQKSDLLMADEIRKEFEKVVKEHENN